MFGLTMGFIARSSDEYPVTPSPEPAETEKISIPSRAGWLLQQRDHFFQAPKVI
jgi:hypothetical protein